MYTQALALSDLVVTEADAARARKEIAAIEKANAEARAKYERDLASFVKKLEARHDIIAENEAAAARYAAELQRYKIFSDNLKAENARLKADYEARLKQWEAADYAYRRALVARDAQLSAYGRATAEALARHKVSAPPNYQGCLSQADQLQYAELCRQQSAAVVVRGLGAIQVVPGTPVCAYAELPTCGTLPTLPPHPGAKPPVPPYKNHPGAPGGPKLKTVPAEPARPMQPKLQPVPNLVIAPNKPQAPATPDQPVLPPMLAPQQSSYAVAGLLAVAVVGGGAAYWYVKRKKGKAS